MQSIDEGDLRVLTDRLTKACDRDLDAIQQATASSIKKLKRRIKQRKYVERAEIKDRKARLKRALKRLKRGVPIRKLPTEILSSIFYFYVQYDLPPWCLLKVCKRWRRIATSTPQLWCHIRMSDFPVGCDWNENLPPQYSRGSLDGVKMFSTGKTLVCVSIAQLQAALRLSGAVPLTIAINSPTIEPWASSPILSATPMLLGEPLCGRIEHLVIYWTSNPQHFTSLDITSSTFALLRSISIDGLLSAGCLSLLRAVSSTSSRLIRAQISCEITQELSELQMWGRIQGLTIRQSIARTSALELNRISQKLVNLNRLSQTPISWPNEDTPVSIWRNIHELDLTCDPIHLTHLELPTLDSLNITVRRDWSEDYAMEEFPQLSFPLLSRLKVSTSSPRWLSKLSAPLVRNFSIDSVKEPDSSAGGNLPGESSSMFAGITFPVRELTFGPHCAPEAVISGLKHFSKIRKLIFLFSYKDSILAVLVILGSIRAMLCPRLTQLHFGSETSWVEAFKKDIVPETKQLIKSRRQVGRPLSHLSIYWKRGRGTPQAFID